MDLLFAHNRIANPGDSKNCFVLAPRNLFDDTQTPELVNYLFSAVDNKVTYSLDGVNFKTFNTVPEEYTVLEIGVTYSRGTIFVCGLLGKGIEKFTFLLALDGFNISKTEFTHPYVPGTFYPLITPDTHACLFQSPLGPYLFIESDTTNIGIVLPLKEHVRVTDVHLDDKGTLLFKSNADTSQTSNHFDDLTVRLEHVISPDTPEIPTVPVPAMYDEYIVYGDKNNITVEWVGTQERLVTLLNTYKLFIANFEPAAIDELKSLTKDYVFLTPLEAKAYLNGISADNRIIQLDEDLLGTLTTDNLISANPSKEYNEVTQEIDIGGRVFKFTWRNLSKGATTTTPTTPEVKPTKHTPFVFHMSYFNPYLPNNMVSSGKLEKIGFNMFGLNHNHIVNNQVIKPTHNERASFFNAKITYDSKSLVGYMIERSQKSNNYAFSAQFGCAIALPTELVDGRDWHIETTLLNSTGPHTSLDQKQIPGLVSNDEFYLLNSEEGQFSVDLIENPELRQGDHIVVAAAQVRVVKPGMVLRNKWVLRDNNYYGKVISEGIITLDSKIPSYPSGEYGVVTHNEIAENGVFKTVTTNTFNRTLGESELWNVTSVNVNTFPIEVLNYFNCADVDSVKLNFRVYKDEEVLIDFEYNNTGFGFDKVLAKFYNSYNRERGIITLVYTDVMERVPTNKLGPGLNELTSVSEMTMKTNNGSIKITTEDITHFVVKMPVPQ